MWAGKILLSFKISYWIIAWNCRVPENTVWEMLNSNMKASLNLIFLCKQMLHVYEAYQANLKKRLITVFTVFLLPFLRENFVTVLIWGCSIFGMFCCTTALKMKHEEQLMFDKLKHIMQFYICKCQKAMPYLNNCDLAVSANKVL